MANTDVLAIVPARAGSKGVPGKNVHLLAGHPLIAYAVVAGKKCPAITRVIVSTDSPELARIGRHYGAETPFLRPEELATDTAPDLAYVRHALEWLESEEGWRPGLVVQLRPTTPLRHPGKLEEAIQALVADEAASSLRSAHLLNESPHKMLQIVDNRFTGFFPDDPRPEYFNLPRQSFPAAYQPNGYVDICRSGFVLSAGQLYGVDMLPFITEISAEIDSFEDFAFLEWQLGRQTHPLVGMVAESASKV
ncbi:MAG: acylneuraminate cytidylyltransferase family protein [Chthoniobacterales bacterium]|nr:acylneuraminate cytidylyltransferase family protein [Chthoniobacterales bacterium]